MVHEVQGVISRVKDAPVELTTVLVPDPGPGEALVQVQACGVCHTDLHYKQGGIGDDYPYLLGHEAAGDRRGRRRRRHRRAAGRLRHPELAGRLRVVPGVPARPPVVLLRHPQRQQKMTLADGTPLSPALGIGAFVEKTLVAAGQCTKVDPEAPAEGRRPAGLRRDGRHRRGDQHRQRRPRRLGGRHRLRRRG